MRVVAEVVAASLAAVAGMAEASTKPVPAPAQPPAVAVSPWQVDYGDNQCLALRKYRVGAVPFILLIVPDPGGRSAKIAFGLDHVLPGLAPGYRGAKLRIDNHALDDGLVVAPLKDGLIMAGGYVRQDGEEKLSLATAHRLTVEAKAFSATIPLDPIAKAVPVLDDCNADLFASWGFSRADQARMAVAATSIPSIPRLFRTDDYPSESVRAGHQGTVLVSYRIGEDGKVSDCVVRRASGDPLLDRKTCDVIVGRGHFKPARDHEGKALATIDIARIRWVLPED